MGTAAQTNITSVGTLTALTVDNVSINGTTAGHTSDTDLMTLADGSVTFTGSTVIATADINGGAIDGTVIGGATPAAGTFTLTVDDQLIVNAGVSITGDTTDEITLNVKGVASQTADLLTVENSDGTDKLTAFGAGVTAAASLVAAKPLILMVGQLMASLGTNSAVTQLVVDNININGSTDIGHTSDTDLMTLASGSVTFTGSTVIATADINGGAIDGVTIGTNSPNRIGCR